MTAGMLERSRAPGERLLPATMALMALLGLALLLRSLVLVATAAGLQVDEAQYWDWSRHLQWGYWSKPPGIAAVIAASTTIFGDGLLGVKLLSMALWPLAAGVLAALAWDMAGRGQIGAQAGLWTAALLLGTPAAGILGMAATTDAPLLLMWALCMALTWRALQTPAGTSPLPWWALAGLALGLGLLSKYTMAAITASWALLLLKHWRRHGLGMVMAGALALAVFAPNILWNASNGWPTLGHTAEITVAAQTPASGRALAVLEFILGQALLLGPVGLVTALVAWRARRAGAAGTAPGSVDAGRFALMFALPLLAVALAQSVHSRANINWTVPALLGLCLCLGLYIAPRLGRRAWWISTALAFALPAGASLMGALPSVQQGAMRPGPHLDLWARMRGWQPVLQQFEARLQAHPGLPVAATSRELVAHARYVWRALDRPVKAWPGSGKPRHHYEQFEALWAPGQRAPERILLLTNAPLSDHYKKQYPHWQRLDTAQWGKLNLELWLASEQP